MSCRTATSSSDTTVYHPIMELPAPGQIFQRKYKLQEVLGRGGFAAVYRATDIEIGRDVAIKVLAPSDDGYSTGIATRFMREARVIGGFQDPHTITMFEFGHSDDGLLFMVFEYVRGDDLSKVIRQRGPLPQKDVAHILKQLLQSLREAHAASVLHRDLKPANILVYDYMGDSNRVKLLDFGIAKAVAGDDAAINLTREGAMIGTPRYMSPEQIYGGDLNARSDLYSLGLVAHEMLVGRPAITGTTSKEMLRAQLSDEPVRLPRDKVLATAAFCGIIDRLTARDPEQRFESAAEVMHALDWIEHNDAEPVPLGRSGMLPAMDSSGISIGYATPSGEGARSDEFVRRPAEPPYNQGQRAPYPAHHDSGAHPAPHQSGGILQQPGHGYPPHQSGSRSGPIPVRPSTQEDAFPPSTERPRTIEEEDGDLPLGTILGAGLGAAALVVGLLMLMSFLGHRDDATQAQPAKTPEPSATATHGAVTPPAIADDSQVDAGAADTVAVQDLRNDNSPPLRTGCGKPAPWRGRKLMTTKDRSFGRQWFAYLPLNYASDREHPLVIMFHDTLGDGESLVDDTRFTKEADKHGFIIVAPNVRDVTQPWPGDDGPFVARIIDEITSSTCVDRSQVFAIGHGQGAVMARDLPCTVPISAVAISGDGIRVGESLCQPDEPVPVIRMQGVTDRYTPFHGGKGCLGGEFNSIHEVEAKWLTRNRCTSEQTRYSKKNKHVCYTWKCEQPFVSCHLDGGHDWPTFARSIEAPHCVAEAPDFPFAVEIWKFFQEHGRKLEIEP